MEFRHANVGNNYTINVSANGSSDYTLSGAFSGNDPPINITLGDTLTFNVNASGHPFYLKTSNTTGTSDAITVSNNGTSSGTITWSPTTAGTYYYICEYHAGMVGTITVTNNAATYAWSTGETTQTIYADTAGTYNVTVGNGSPSNTNSLDFDGAASTKVEFNNLSSLNAGNGDYITLSFWMDWNDGDDCMPISLKYYDLIFYSNGFGFITLTCSSTSN